MCFVCNNICILYIYIYIYMYIHMSLQGLLHVALDALAADDLPEVLEALSCLLF